jgi:hypothetical protein
MRFACPYLAGEVELTDERWEHIRSAHPELRAEAVERIARTLAEPDQVRVDRRFPGTRLFSRWFDDLLEGKIAVVAVVTEDPEAVAQGPRRHWIVTAYATRRHGQGTIEWARP